VGTTIILTAAVHPLMDVRTRQGIYGMFYIAQTHEVVQLKQKYKIKLNNIVRILLIIMIIIKSLKLKIKNVHM